MKIQTLFSLAAVGLAFASPIQNLEERDDIPYAKCVTDAIQKIVNDACAARPDDCTLREEWASCMARAGGKASNILELFQITKHLRDQFHICYEGLQGGDGVPSVPGLYQSIEKNAMSVHSSCHSSAPII
ncbi:hypothetical protein BDV38DRAFT_284888 [Aspergillus pseudotamarii]|uniref:Extracellular membrane protein CFEM domain-containing protein n=1 Tax=Aspergillus pseudotamarii TaxID=132259 RepID=A0A5N6SNU9_ASPPS|nr:uncharacterized protein BDV38DRAFT_284888 [Aspergillus pseudotamarii]KAE8135450.1 hypothetical protein BDV38DRAFT_284888 [Aspergillus pseudotamarii]